MVETNIAARHAPRLTRTHFHQNCHCARSVAIPSPERRSFRDEIVRSVIDPAALLAMTDRVRMSDPMAERVARAAHDALNPVQTIRSGSPARGGHRSYSDIDICVITGSETDPDHRKYSKSGAVRADNLPVLNRQSIHKDIPATVERLMRLVAETSGHGPAADPELTA